MSNISTQPLKGFRDFLPEDMAFQSWFYTKIKQVSSFGGFEEYNGPILENIDLFAAKSGDELVKKQAYTINDKSGNILVLRPEMTPSLARIVANNENNLLFPLKWFTYGPRFRYENPQKGRGREFFEWDCDILGTESYLADAEVILIAASMYRELGLTPQEVKIKINDRVYIQKELTNLGIPNIKGVIKTIDKKSKVGEETFENILLDEGLKKDQIERLSGILANKEGFNKSPRLSEIFSVIEKSDLKDYVEFDPCIVRGLDYYTSTVFEGWAIKGEFRSIWGGGRYDNLTEQVGSRRSIPGVGFAMGDMVIKELLKVNGKMPQLETVNSRVLVTIFSNELKNTSISTLNDFRKSKVPSEIYLEPKDKLDKQIKYADKKGIPFVVVIGPKEKKEDKVTLKDLKTGEQTTLSLNEVANKIKSSST